MATFLSRSPHGIEHFCAIALRRVVIFTLAAGIGANTTTSVPERSSAAPSFQDLDRVLSGYAPMPNRNVPTGGLPTPGTSRLETAKVICLRNWPPIAAEKLQPERSG